MGGGGKLKIELFNTHIKRMTINNLGRNNHISIKGGNIYHKCKILFQGNDNIIVIKKGCKLADLNILIRGDGCLVEIGEGTTSNGTSCYCIGSGHRLIVGQDCMFARDTELWTSDAHDVVSKESGSILNARHDILIGNHVWLAEHAKVLKGVHIKDGSVIGMGCIQTKDALPNSIYVGIPGRKAKDNITWNR